MHQPGAKPFGVNHIQYWFKCMKYRLGIDLGTNSLGWAIFEISTPGKCSTLERLVTAGVRIYSDGRNPKDKQSNAVKRREPRSARRNRDRYLRRRKRLMRQLIQYGLMPTDPKARKALEGGKTTPLVDSDPWILRARALNEQITPYQLGRALFHLHQRRGFKSNRKMDRADSESGKIYDAIEETKKKFTQNDARTRTLGELFGQRRLNAYAKNQAKPKGKRRPQPLARVRKSGEGSKWAYDCYPTRDLVLDEFDQIWAAQQSNYPELLSDEACKTIRDTIEWQHELKPQPVGKCALDPEKERAPKALSSAQRAHIRGSQQSESGSIGSSSKNSDPKTTEYFS